MSTQRKPIVFCVVGPAGSGKTSLSKALLSRTDSKLIKSVSATSRAPRPGEVDGVNYRFLKDSEFRDLIKQGEFFEWEEIHGNLYGQLKTSLESALRSGSDVVLDIDIRGAESVKGRYPSDCVCVFLLPPSLEALKQRILARAPISAEELSKRMSTCEAELAKFWVAYRQNILIDYCLVNEDFDNTLAGLWNIVQSERQRLSRADERWLSSLIGAQTQD